MSDQFQQENQNNKNTAKKSGPIQQIKEFFSTAFWAIVIVVIVRSFLLEPCNVPSGSMYPTLLVGDYIFVTKYSYGYSKYSFPFSQPAFKGRIFYKEPKRGDVAVFMNTKEPQVYYVKRIIGLPGDTIQVKDSVLYLNGQPVKRTFDGTYLYKEYADSQTITENLYTEYLPRKDGTIAKHQILQDIVNDYYQSTIFPTGELNVDYTIPYHVPEGHFFAMGDNRDHSADSRFIDKNSPDYLGFVPINNLIGKVQFIFYSYDHQYPTWQFWHWPQEIRWNRLFKAVR